MPCRSGRPQQAASKAAQEATGPLGRQTEVVRGQGEIGQSAAGPESKSLWTGVGGSERGRLRLGRGCSFSRDSSWGGFCFYCLWAIRRRISTLLTAALGRGRADCGASGRNGGDSGSDTTLPEPVLGAASASSASGRYGGESTRCLSPAALVVLPVEDPIRGGDGERSAKAENKNRNSRDSELR